MAFIFVPNADGGFDEGDKQTNPDTGVEYIYLDGAWRALGPKIEDEFDTLDERYIKKTGDTMTGNFTLTNSRNTKITKFDGTNQWEIRPNIGDYFTNIYSYNASGMRFRVATDQNVGSYDTMISITGETQEIGDATYRGTAFINRVRTPYNDDHAANKWYVDNAIAEAIEDIDLGDVDLDGYLPLSGGTLSNSLNINPSNLHALTVYEAGGLRTRLFRNGDVALYGGKLETNGLIKSIRNTGHAFEVAKGGTVSSYLHTDGSLLLRPEQTGTDKGFSVWAKGLADDNSKCAFKVQGDGRVRAGHSNSEAFMASESSDIVTKKYLDETVDEYVTLTTEQTITARKTFGSVHNSSTNAMNIKGKVQVNGDSGSKGQVLTSNSTSGVVKWDNVVSNGSSNAGANGCFYEANNALYYRTY